MEVRIGDSCLAYHVHFASGAGSRICTSVGIQLGNIASLAMMRRNQCSAWRSSDQVTNEALIGRFFAEFTDDFSFERCRTAYDPRDLPTFDASLLCFGTSNQPFVSDIQPSS